MKLGIIHLIIILMIGVGLGMVIKRKQYEGFDNSGSVPNCTSCGKQSPCGCPAPKPVCVCAPCKEVDMSKYVLKSTVPPCPDIDLTQYVKKTDIPPCPNLDNYVLKSSVPKQSPVILDCSKCNKPKGECPPCPRPRCPPANCPIPKPCPVPAPCPRPICPPAVVKCKAENPVSDIKPFMAPLNFREFGM
jgi:hypothetical protein